MSVLSQEAQFGLFEQFGFQSGRNVNKFEAFEKCARGLNGIYYITEGTTLSNPHWEYSRNKSACEEFLMKMYRENGFPVTIIRTSHT